MARLAYYWDAASLLHDTGRHVERIARAQRLEPGLMRAHVPRIDPRPVVAHDAVEWVLKVHARDYHDHVRAVCLRGGGLLDEGDTVASGRSYEAALVAVNAVLSAADSVMAGEAETAFCAIRPPGHHALPQRAMGFCLFANVAIAARYLRERHRVGKIAIVDFDVHHGNGTQDIFYEDPSVLFVSLHQHPLWPGTGQANETGRGRGKDRTLNVQIAPFTSEAAYLEAFRANALPFVDEFRPELLLVSAGFDAHAADPLANLQLTERGFAEITRALRELAQAHCGGRLISSLEGGYDLDALEASVAAHVQELSQ